MNAPSAIRTHLLNWWNVCRWRTLIILIRRDRESTHNQAWSQELSRPWMSKRASVDRASFIITIALRFRCLDTTIEAALRCMFIFIILARRSAKYFSYEVRVISKWFATIEKGKSPWPAKYYPLELEGHYPNISSKSGHMPNLWRFSSQRGF